ncbi:MAG: TylF/MycF/NovP-related O-methyltransferase [Chlamydiales bacterium]
MKKIFRKILSNIPVTKQILEKRDLKKQLFTPCCYLGNKTTPEAMRKQLYEPAFLRIFDLLSCYMETGLEGDIFEFGVHNGFSSKIFADSLQYYPKLKCKLHLFDSFKGLPNCEEDKNYNHECVEGLWKEGSMGGHARGIEQAIHRGLEAVVGKGRVFVTKGFFEERLPSYLDKLENPKAAVVHLDCDLYSSSRFVMKTLLQREMIQDGTFILCDDWLTSRGHPQLGQRKAVTEILTEYSNWQLEPLFNYGFSQAFLAHDMRITFTDHQSKL